MNKISNEKLTLVSLKKKKKKDMTINAQRLYKIIKIECK